MKTITRGTMKTITCGTHVFIVGLSSSRSVAIGHLVCLVQACVKGLYLYLYL